MSWIKIADRAPTASDFGPLKAVEYFCDRTGQRYYATSFERRGYVEGFTHWRTVDLPPPPAKELTQKDRDKADFKAWWNATTVAPSVLDCYLAGIYAERRAILKELNWEFGCAWGLTEDNCTATMQALRKRLNEQGGA